MKKREHFVSLGTTVKTLNCIRCVRPNRVVKPGPPVFLIWADERTHASANICLSYTIDLFKGDHLEH